MSEGEAPDHDEWIKVADSELDEEHFKRICSELGNRNVRAILREISNGFCTSPEITRKVNLSIQDTIKHLSRLENLGLIEVDGRLSVLRGRASKHYRICSVAVLLLPSGIANKNQVKEIVERRAREILRKRLVVSASTAITSFFLAFWYLWKFTLPTWFMESNIVRTGTGLPSELLFGIVAFIVSFVLSAAMFYLARQFVDMVMD